MCEAVGKSGNRLKSGRKDFFEMVVTGRISHCPAWVKAVSSTRVKICPTCSAGYGNDVGFCPRDGSALRSSAGLEPGAVIREKYEILSEIGRGGMGVVYRARHLIWNEEKALKVLVASVSEGQPGLKSLMAEALVMRQLQHPHIVRVEDADYTEDDQPFVVMEYVEGQSLRQKLDREGPLAPRACIADRRADVLGVVGCAPKGDHSPGYQASEPAAGQERGRQRDSEGHRFRDRERARGSRTGLHGHDDRHDRILRGHARVRVARTGARDARERLGWAHGPVLTRLVLYEMLTGRLPFAADTPVALLVQRLQVQPMPPDRLRPDLNISLDVSKLVMEAIEKERENRYRSAEEMERAIAAVLEGRRAERERRGGGRRGGGERARLQKKTVAKASQAQRDRVGPPGPEHKESATTVLGRRELSRRWRIGYGIAAGALALVGFFVARSLTEKPAQDIAGIQVVPYRPAGASKMNPKDGLRYVWVPPGKFTMGCSAGDSDCGGYEKPAHQVTITKGFWLGQTEVTQAPYQRVVGTNSSYFKGADLPVEEVSWDQAQAYCQAIGGRL